MNALGMIETNAIPVGVNAGDAMLKAASVELVTAQPVCAGKYIVIITGEVAAVKESVDAGKAVAGQRLVDSMVISHVHEQVPKAINACNEIGQVAAVGVMEAFSLCTAVVAADAAVKAADEGDSGRMFVIDRVSDDPYQSAAGIYDVHKIANGEKLVPRSWINEEGTNVTQDFVDYVRPLIQGDDPCILVGGLPRHLHLPADQD